MPNRNKLRNFPAGVTENLYSYVYLYFDPNSPLEPFYIGKGIGDRVFSHFNEADNCSLTGRKIEKIREIWGKNQDVRIYIARHGLNDNEAKQVEATLIDLFPSALNEVAGNASVDRGMKPIDNVVEFLQAPEATIELPAVVITINRRWPELSLIRNDRFMGDDSKYQEMLYWATRSYWKIRPNRHPKVGHAISYAAGLVRQIYTIERWRIADVDGDNRPIESGTRLLFDGHISESHAHLIGCALTPEQRPKQGAQNPIRYLNSDSNRQIISN